MKILDHKSAINRRQYEGLIIVLTAIYRVSCLNRTVLTEVGTIHEFPLQCLVLRQFYASSKRIGIRTQKSSGLLQIRFFILIIVSFLSHFC
jgi:hypothetical protein